MRRRQYRVRLPETNPYSPILTNINGDSATTALIDAAIYGIAVSIPADTKVHYKIGEKVDVTLTLRSLDDPLSYGAIVMISQITADGEQQLGLQLLEPKLLERQLPQRYYSVFNRRRETRIPRHELPHSPNVELELPNGRRYHAVLTDLSDSGMGVLIHTAFAISADGSRQFNAFMDTDNTAVPPLQTVVHIVREQWSGSTVHYGFVCGATGAAEDDPENTIDALLDVETAA